MATIKVRIPAFTVEVDEEAWLATYGPNDSVREDVKRYIIGGIDGSAAASECGLTVVQTSSHRSGRLR